MIHMTVTLTLSEFYKKAGWSASGGREGYEVSLAGLFQHICLPYQKQFLQRLDYYELNLLESYYENEKGFFNFTGFILRRDSPSS